jgi:hypothetical protein
VSACGRDGAGAAAARRTGASGRATT